MQRIRDEGYTVLTVQDFADKALDDALPEKVATLCFFDGLRCGYEHAYPILREFEYPATFYIMTDTLECRIPKTYLLIFLLRHFGGEDGVEEFNRQLLAGKYLSETLEILYRGIQKPDFDLGWLFKRQPLKIRPVKVAFNCFLPHYIATEALDKFLEEVMSGDATSLCQEAFISLGELMEMQKAGMEISSHTISHPDLSTLDCHEIEREFRHSPETLRQTGFTGKSLGYPLGGIFSERVRRLAAKCGYSCAMNYQYAPNIASAGGLFDIMSVDQREFEVGV